MTPTSSISSSTLPEGALQAVPRQGAPADYGRDLAPSPQKSRYSNVLSVEPSPSGDLIAAMSGNQRDRELDILLLSPRTDRSSATSRAASTRISASSRFRPGHALQYRAADVVVTAG
jgi:hypothetical protein